jgi:hypothetical protein
VLRPPLLHEGLGRHALALAAVIFGAATVAAGGRVLLGVGSAREAAGSYLVPVVAFNFAAGFAYVAAGVGLALRRRWAGRLATALAAATLVVSAAFGLHVAAGGAYEPRTAIALALRSAYWIAFAAGAPRLLAAGPAARR